MTRRWLAAMATILATTGLVGIPSEAWADTTRDNQWYLHTLRIPEAHAISQGEGVIVAVIDSGVDAQHPDLAGNVLPGKNMTGPDDKGWSDPTGHGTGTAALIAGHGHGPDGDDGILGIPPKAKILPITVPEGSLTQGKTYMSDAIRWATSQGANVINISMSSGYDDAVRAISDALRAGIVVVAAAGNTTSGDSDIAWPAADPDVVAVSATDQNGDFSDVSVHGANMDVAAPGVDIPVPVGRDEYVYDIDGTSSSAPIVSGVFALTKAKYPNETRQQWGQRTLGGGNVLDKGPPGSDDYYGVGIIDPVLALTGVPHPLAKRAEDPSAPPSKTSTSSPVAAEPGDSGTSVPMIASIAVAVALVISAAIVVTVRRRRRTPTT